MSSTLQRETGTLWTVPLGGRIGAFLGPFSPGDWIDWALVTAACDSLIAPFDPVGLNFILCDRPNDGFSLVTGLRVLRYSDVGTGMHMPWGWMDTANGLGSPFPLTIPMSFRVGSDFRYLGCYAFSLSANATVTFAVRFTPSEPGRPPGGRVRR